MNAEIISVGTELLLGHTVNTDTTIVARALSDLGINLLYACTVGFEDSFVIPVSDSQAYKQFGNAVTVNVSRAVAQSVKSTFINLGEWVD